MSKNASPSRSDLGQEGWRPVTTILPRRTRNKHAEPDWPDGPSPRGRSMNGFVIAPMHNRPGQQDATAFHVGAKAFSAMHGLPAPALFENEGEATANFLEQIEMASGCWDVFAYFGHGESEGLPSAGAHGRSGAELVAKSILVRANKGIKVVLYAGNAGKPGGFASWLAEELAPVKPTVFSHVPPAGHAFTNANVATYPGGHWVISRSHRLWGDWQRDMKAQKNSLWARFPFLTREQLEGELEAPDHLLGRWHVCGKMSSWDVVFFGDRLAVRTEAGSRFAVTGNGIWSVTGHRLTVAWASGDTETWALPLTLRDQSVKHATGGETRMLKAHRTETIDMNPANNLLRPLPNRPA